MNLKEFEIAFASKYLQGYYNRLIPHTKGTTDFKNRGFKHAFAYAQGRLVDDAEAMLSEYRKNDNDTPRRAPLPMILVGVGRDYTPTTGDYSRIRGDIQTIKLPHEKDDNKLREMTVEVGERKVQVVFIASNEPTARDLSMQFCLWCAAFKNRRFYADYDIHGHSYPFSCVLEDPNIFASNVDTEQKNLVMQTVDLTFRETIPFVSDTFTEGVKEITETNNDTRFKRKIDGSGVTILNN